MKAICEGWGMKYNEQFSGMTMMRPYNPKKLLTKKVEKQDVIRMQLEMKKNMK